VFGTPIAAVLLAVELLLFEWKPRSFIPVTVASHYRLHLAAAFDRAGPLFPYAGDPAMPWWGLGLCALAGLIAGAQSSLLTLLLYGMEDVFSALPIHWMWWPALGGLAVGIGGLIDPAVLGVGYDNIQLLLADRWACRRPSFFWSTRPCMDRGAVVRHLRRRAGAAADPGRGAGRGGSAIGCHCVDGGFWAQLLGMTAILGGHHARAAHRHPVRGGTDGQFPCPGPRCWRPALPVSPSPCW
jgi:hypothetical protein